MPDPNQQWAPVQSPLTARGDFISKVWADYITRELTPRLEQTAQVVESASALAQSAAVGATALVLGASGLYRVGFQVRVVTPAGVSSSVAVVIGTTEGGITCTQTSSAFTGNVNNTPASGFVLVRPDDATTITYSTTYASVAAGMVYDLVVTAERIG